MKARVPLYGKPQGFAYVDTEATKGATLGTNLYWSDGSLVSESALSAAISAATAPTTPTAAGNDLLPTVWDYLLQVPPNVQALEDATGTGLFAVTGASTGAFRSLTAPAAGFTITNPAGIAGDPTFVLANDLAALEGLGATGIAVRTASDTWAQRTITGTADKVDVSNGDGVSGNPTLTISPTYVGQTSITTLGTIATGVWSGTAVGLAYGGTGADYSTRVANTVWAGPTTGADAAPAFRALVAADVPALDYAPEVITSTGIISGGVLSINADPTKLDITAGTGYIADQTTDPPTIRTVTWSAKTAVVLTNLATAPSTDIAIDENGDVVQQSLFTQEEVRGLIFLGGVDHSGNTVINNTFCIQVPANGIGSGLRELTRAIGDINISGNVFGANGANLKLDKSSGTSFAYGRSNDVDKDDPHTVAQALQSPVTFRYVRNNGSGVAAFGSSVTDIDPANYDNGTGTLAAVTGTRWTIQRLLMFSNTGTVFVQYGTEEFLTLAAAVDGLATSSFVALDGIRTAMVRGYLIVKANATALNNSTQAAFVTADRFGGVGGRDTSGGTVTWGNVTGTLSDQTDLQAALDAKQPIDATLTAFAALTIAADSLTIGTGADAFSQTTFAANTFPAKASTGNLVSKSITDFGLSLVDDATASDARTTLGLVIGTNVQAYDAELAALAGLTSAADALPYFTGAGTATTTTLTSFARTLLDDTTASAARSTLGLVIGTNVQAWDATLDTFAAMALTGTATSASFLRGDGVWANWINGPFGVGTAPAATTSFYITSPITGGVSAYGVLNAPVVQSGVTTLASGLRVDSATVAAAFTLGQYRGVEVRQGSIGAGSAITNQYAFFADSTLTGATNNYGFYSGIAAATGRWNFYAAGTANNYMAGALGIGTTSLTGFNFVVSKSITGAATAYSAYLAGNVESDVTTAYGYRSAFSTAAGAFTVATLNHHAVGQGTFGAGSAVTTQYGYHALSSLTGATNNYGFFSNIAAATGRWNFYAAGTARNYFAGSVGVGSATDVPSALLYLTSTTQGFRPPVMTTAQRDAISSPAAGLIIYNTTTAKLNVYTTAWEAITSA